MAAFDPAVLGAVGTVIAERTVVLTRDSLVRYAGASGDFNPIHYRDDVAAEVGLPGVLAHGMLTLGVAAATVADAVAAVDPTAVVLDIGARFTRPVVVDPAAGAEVTVSAAVTAVTDDTASVTVTVTYDERTVLAKCVARIGAAGA